DRGGHAFVVVHPPAIEIAVLLRDLEGGHGPRLPFHGHDVDVRDEQERTLLAGSLVTGDEVAAPRGALHELQWKSRGAEAVRDRPDSVGLVTVARVDGDELVHVPPRIRDEGGFTRRRGRRSGLRRRRSGMRGTGGEGDSGERRAYEAACARVLLQGGFTRRH